MASDITKTSIRDMLNNSSCVIHKYDKLLKSDKYNIIGKYYKTYNIPTDVNIAFFRDSKYLLQKPVIFTTDFNICTKKNKNDMIDDIMASDRLIDIILVAIRDYNIKNIITT